MTCLYVVEVISQTRKVLYNEELYLLKVKKFMIMIISYYLHIKTLQICFGSSLVSPLSSGVLRCIECVNNHFKFFNF